MTVDELMEHLRTVPNPDTTIVQICGPRMHDVTEVLVEYDSHTAWSVTLLGY